MKSSEALRIAKAVMATRPHYILCGSVALIHAKILPDRKVGDIDFCCLKENFKPETLGVYGDYPPTINDGYECWKISTDPLTGFYYNVFVFDDYRNLSYKIIDGIKVQSIHDIIGFKKQYGRIKDVADIELIRKEYDV